jgi:hypothetical protein
MNKVRADPLVARVFCGLVAQPLGADRQAGDDDMCSDWNRWKDSESDEWSNGDAWSAELSFGDADAWKGDAAEGPDAWPAGSLSDSDAWRGTLHLEDWPVWNAGPEYHMWKRLAEDDAE